ncbi:MAG: GYD domain-containing protein [Candidatus Rokuibacteriota bacterium]
MPTYMVQAAYTGTAWSKLTQRPENRMEAIKPVIERLDGRLLAWYYTFGEYDVVVLFEVPSNVNAAAASMAIAGGGAVKEIKTTALMSPDEGFDAMLLAQGAGYRAPGT